MVEHTHSVITGRNTKERRPELAALQRLVLSPALLGLALTILAWPPTALGPQGGIDQSWQVILAMSAAKYHFAWGPQLVFTFGPLGFLNYLVLYSGGTAAASFVYLLVLRWAVFGSLVWALKRSFPLPVAVVAAYLAGVAAIVYGQPELLLGVVFIWAIGCLRGELSPPVRLWSLVALGVVSGFALLDKANVGLLTLAECAVVVVGMARWQREASPGGRGRADTRWNRWIGPERPTSDGAQPITRHRWAEWLTPVVIRLGVLVGTFAVTFLAGWVASGNALGNIPNWIAGTGELSAGYSSAMQLEVPSQSSDYWRVLIVVALVGLGLFRFYRSGRPFAGQRWTVPVLALIVLFGGFKESFVRHNLHSIVFFFLAILIFGGLALVIRDRWVLVVSLAASAVFVFQSAGTFPWQAFSPPSGFRAAGRTVLDLASSSRRLSIEQSARSAMRAQYAASGLTPAMATELAGRSVLVDPWEESVTWAYPQMRLDPLPLFGEYAAYVPGLDQRDAALVSSARGPDDILREAGPGLDGRYPFFDSPDTQLAMLCRYRQVVTSGSWAILARGPDRCGQATPLGVVTSKTDRWVRVPAPPRANEAVLARFTLSPPWWRGVSAVLFKPPTINAVVNGGTQFRFIVGTAPDQHLMSAPPEVGYSGVFAPLAIQRIRFSGSGVGGQVTVTFEAVPIRLAAPAP